MKVSKGEIGSLDRTSELPEFILHLVLSKLSTKEACRASILSKKWYSAWGSIPILDFQPNLFNKDLAPSQFYDEEAVQCYMGFIDKTMRRYSIHKYFIKRINLEFYNCGEGYAPLIDKWVGIVVERRIEEFKIYMILEDSPKYILPEILFSAKSLKTLECHNVALPYYGTMKIHSLECLRLIRVSINEAMLEHILDSCPLTNIDLQFCPGLENTSIPWVHHDNHDSAKLMERNVLHHDIKESKLDKFVYFGLTYSSWPFKMIVGVLKNLRTLKIYYAGITDDIISILASELSSLELLELSSCFMLKSVEISSKTLKILYIVECFELKKATIDAPNLLEFWYNGDPKPCLSLINAQVQCDTHFYVAPEFLSISWLRTLRKFLLKSNIFKTLDINFADCISEIETEDMLKQIGVAPVYKLKELNLHENEHWVLNYSSLSTFFDGLFQSCRPDVLTVLTTNFQNATVQIILESLKEKVKCWRHPLKHIEVEAVDFSNLLSISELNIRLRLSW